MKKKCTLLFFLAFFTCTLSGQYLNYDNAYQVLLDEVQEIQDGDKSMKDIIGGTNLNESQLINPSTNHPLSVYPAENVSIVMVRILSETATLIYRAEDTADGIEEAEAKLMAQTMGDEKRIASSEWIIDYIKDLVRN